MLSTLTPLALLAAGDCPAMSHLTRLCHDEVVRREGAGVVGVELVELLQKFGDLLLTDLPQLLELVQYSTKSAAPTRWSPSMSAASRSVQVVRRLSTHRASARWRCSAPSSAA